MNHDYQYFLSRPIAKEQRDTLIIFLLTQTETKRNGRRRDTGTQIHRSAHTHERKRITTRITRHPPPPAKTSRKNPKLWSALLTEGNDLLSVLGFLDWGSMPCQHIPRLPYLYFVKKSALPIFFLTLASQTCYLCQFRLKGFDTWSIDNALWQTILGQYLSDQRAEV